MALARRLPDSLSAEGRSAASEAAAAGAGAANGNADVCGDLSEERFRVDRRKLEAMIAVGEEGARLGSAGDTTTPAAEESGEEFFARVMRETNTVITWPCKLKIGAKSKKDPHVKVRGAAVDVAKARELIVAVLDTKSNRVALKMDVPHTEHSHVIGKGGSNIRSIMEETNCHIHFPDCSGGERRTNVEKSTQVSITGQPEGVEVARKRIRDTLPLVLSFELPSETNPDSTSPPIQEILTEHNVSISFRARSRSSEMFCQVRGCQYQEHDVVAATEKLWELWKTQSGKSFLGAHPVSTLQVMSTMDVAQQHHSALRGRANINSKFVEKEAGVQITFPLPGSSSSIVVKGPPQAVCLARRLLSDYLPLVLMFDIAEEKGMSTGMLSSLADSLAEQWDIHVSITPKSKQLAYAVKVKGLEGKAAHLYQARQALLQNEQRKPTRLPTWSSSKHGNSQLSQGIHQQTQQQPPAPQQQQQPLPPQQQQQQQDGGETPDAGVDLRPHAGSLSLSWSAQQLQMETSHRAQQNSAELSQYQFQRSFNEDIFGRSEGGEKLNVSHVPDIIMKTSADLSDSFGHSSDGAEKHGPGSALGPPPGIYTPPKFSPHQSPMASPAKGLKKTKSSSSSQTYLNPVMMDAMAKLPSDSPGQSTTLVKSSSVDSQLSSHLLPQPATSSLQPKSLGPIFNQAQSGQDYPSYSASKTERVEPPRSTHTSPARSGSLDKETFRERVSDYDLKRQQAARVIEEGRKPTAEVVRTPTDIWTGHGFSKSSPEHMLREQLMQQQRFNPSMATMYETEDAAPPESKSPASDDLIGSVPVPLESAVQSTHFPARSSRLQLPGGAASGGASFGSIGDSPSKKRPVNKSDLNWTLWQSWQRSAEPDAGVQTADRLQTTSGSGLSGVRDLTSLLCLLDLMKYQGIFEEQEIDLPIFLTLSEADLKDIGIATFGARRRMMLAINELKQICQQQLENQSLRRPLPQQQHVHTTSSHQHTPSHQFVQQTHLPQHVMRSIVPHTSSSGTSGSGASISAPSSDCSNSEGSGGILQDLLNSSAGRAQLSSAVQATSASTSASHFENGSSASVGHENKKPFPISQSTHW